LVSLEDFDFWLKKVRIVPLSLARKRRETGFLEKREPFFGFFDFFDFSDFFVIFWFFRFFAYFCFFAFFCLFLLFCLFLEISVISARIACTRFLLFTPTRTPFLRLRAKYAPVRRFHAPVRVTRYMRIRHPLGNTYKGKPLFVKRQAVTRYAHPLRASRYPSSRYPFKASRYKASRYPYPLPV
jgi:hypothetical protein